MTPKQGSFKITHDQKWYHLATILSTPLSLPMIVLGQQLNRQYGPGTAICSILIGNIILWLIGMTVISMASENKSNAIENVKSYLGKYGAVCMWLILMASIINWFVHQLNAVVPSIGIYLGQTSVNSLVKLGAGIGFFTTLLSIGGISLLKHATLISFPVIFCYYAFSIFESNFSISSISTWGVSAPAIISTLLVLLPGMVNLPTLYRHSHSKADSYLGLTLMILLISFYEISTLWMRFTDDWTVEYSGGIHSFQSTWTFIFIVATLIYINLINIYFASACWETYFPRFEGAKGYVIVGLMGTAAYTFMQVNAPILFFSDLTNCYIGNLGIVLMIAFLIRVIVRHRPRPFEKTLSGLSWLSGCIASTLLIVKNLEDAADPILVGAGVTTLTFLFIIFVEETVWAAKKLML